MKYASDILDLSMCTTEQDVIARFVGAGLWWDKSGWEEVYRMTAEGAYENFMQMMYAYYVRSGQIREISEEK